MRSAGEGAELRTHNFKNFENDLPQYRLHGITTDPWTITRNRTAKNSELNGSLDKCRDKNNFQYMNFFSEFLYSILTSSFCFFFFSALRGVIFV